MVSESVQIGDDVIFQQIEGEVVLLNMANQQYYSLDKVGAEFWQTLLDLGDLNEATEKLATTYDTDKERIRIDLARLVSELTDLGLLKPR